MIEDLRFEPLTPARWSHFRELFGERGAFGGCWCMWWRQTRREFETCHGAENERRMRSLVESGHVPGLLAYASSRVAGWVSVGPREAFPSLNRSRILKPADAVPVWAIVCFYVDPEYRQRGLMAALLEAACDYAKAQGATAVEGFPVDPDRLATGLPTAMTSGYMGLRATFDAVGFVEVARRNDRQPVMRRAL